MKGSEQVPEIPLVRGERREDRLSIVKMRDEDEAIFKNPRRRTCDARCAEGKRKSTRNQSEAHGFPSSFVPKHTQGSIPTCSTQPWVVVRSSELQNYCCLIYNNAVV